MWLAQSVIMLVVLGVLPIQDQTKPSKKNSKDTPTVVTYEVVSGQVEFRWEAPVLTEDQYRALAQDLKYTDGINSVSEPSGKTVKVTLDPKRNRTAWSLLQSVLKSFLGDVKIQPSQSNKVNIGK